MTPQLGDQAGAADDQPGLGSAQQLVPGEGHQVGAGGHAVLHGRLGGKPIARRVEKGAAAQIIHHGQSDAVCQRHHVRQRHLRGEADLLEVGRVNTQQERRLRADGVPEVAQVRAVGGPHLDQVSAALTQHIGDAKPAADLHELAV